MSNLQKYRDDLSHLVKSGNGTLFDLLNRHPVLAGKSDDTLGKLERNYQHWYTESSAAIKQLLPARLTEFKELYMPNGRRKEINVEAFNIQDWLNGIRSHKDLVRTISSTDDFECVIMRFRNQLEILRSSEVALDSALINIKQFVQADLFDSELEVARELIKYGFLRASGAVGGVILEKHLSQVLANHYLKTRKKTPTIE